MRDIQQVAKYIGLSLILKELTVSPLKLQKLLYYLQAWYMVFFGRENTMFDDIPQAWVNGPVYPSVYLKYRDLADNMCDHLDATAFTNRELEDALKDLSIELNLNKDEEELIDSIVMLYGSMSQNKLIFLTHSELPWVEAREGLAPYERSDNEISLDTMYEFYKKRHDRNKSRA